MITDDLVIRLPMSPFLTATLTRAADYAVAQSHVEVSVEHLLLALTEDPEASVVLKSSSVDVGRLNNEVSDFIGRIEDRHPEGAGGNPVLSSDLRRILEAAAAAAQQGRRREINGAIVLAAIVGDGKSGAAHMLRSQGLTFEEAIRALQRAAQSKAAPAAPSTDPHTSADDLLASARERVQSRSTAQRDAPAEPVPTATFGRSAPRFESPPPDVPGVGGSRRAPPQLEAPNAFEPDDAFAELTTNPEAQPGAPARPSQADQPSLGPPDQNPYATPDRYGSAQAAPTLEVPDAPAAPTSRPPPPPRRGQSWAPPAPRGPPPPPGTPGPAGAPRGGRVPPPIPTTPGPLQIPGQLPGQHGGLASPAGAAPTLRGAPPARAPWPEAPEAANAPAPAAPRAPAQSPSPNMRAPDATRPRQGGPRTVISSGQLVHNIPPKMKVGISLVCEARIGRAEVKAIVEGLQGGGAVVQQEIMVTKAMSVRLRSPDSGFFIESSSPETQWIENVLGMPAEDFARWRWTITPREKGRKRLQLVVSARTVGADGLAAETAMPDQVIDIRVRTNYGRSLKRLFGWTIAAIVGGILARFGDVAFGVIRSLLGM